MGLQVSALMITINIAKEFSPNPGARYRDDGPASGEEFRQKFLEDLFKAGGAEKIRIILDGTAGYATSFLEEAFGGLVRLDGVSREAVLERLEFESKDEPLLEDEIIGYIKSAQKK